MDGSSSTGPQPQLDSSAASPQSNSAGPDTAGPNSAGRSAVEVARGIKRLFARNDIWCVSEVPLQNGRRADLMGVDAKGLIVIVEIKVARGDLLGDTKWPDYLDHCDRFFWGLSPDLDRAPLEGANFQPEGCGVIVADGYDGEILRPAPLRSLAAARRKSLTTRLARIAARRHSVLEDPQIGAFGSE